MRIRVAVILGVTGQDGSYLADLLLSKLNYKVIGVIRRSSTTITGRVKHLLGHRDFSLFQADICDLVSLIKLFDSVKHYGYIEVYNLAAQSQVHVSFGQPEYTSDVNALGPLRILECIRLLNIEKKVRLFHASTSELFGKVCETPQKETTVFNPRNPYAAGKLYAYWIMRNYRDTYGIFACNGIMFSHESERRGEDFVTRKITKAVNKIYTDANFVLEVGNINAKRDWGHAEDFVNAMCLMLQHNVPDDYVLSSEENHTVREFIEKAFHCKGHTLSWSGSGLDEIATDESGRVVVRIDPKFYRPAEVDELLGDSTKARNTLGWIRKHTFDSIVSGMVENDSNMLD